MFYGIVGRFLRQVCGLCFVDSFLGLYNFQAVLVRFFEFFFIGDVLISVIWMCMI